jgi:hypothetical protein
MSIQEASATQTVILAALLGEAPTTIVLVASMVIRTALISRLQALQVCHSISALEIITFSSICKLPC